MNGFLSPAEIGEVWVGNGVKKASLSIGKMLVLGIFAGIFIGFGAHGFLLATGIGKGALGEAMIAKFIGASVFPAGLMMVILCGAELFTGNNLMTLALMDKKITVKGMLTNWVVVYIGNLIGSILLAFVLAKSGLYADAVLDKAMAVAQAKVGMPFSAALIRGILCNMLVVLACWMQAGSKDMIGKIFAIWFPIMLFVFAGFEHSVANMTYIPLGIFLGADVSWGQMFIDNLLPVTLGNIIGGAIIVPCVYNYAYLRKNKE
ncbi:formate/nitrite transporter family protein [Eubacterium sp. AM05-23]|uniref:formate/nitrite transporter family protein n=1 Tax=Eubacterium TaxID=1730 RepID=UPI000E47D59F|nr:MULTISPECIES: formate/nitrite transporter family protein [Eubacterium]RHO61344.1 formate/nitrite transporter family protein [Eubacterium sp. AM05-23]